MPKYTNNYQLPDYLYQALVANTYDKVPGTLSATGLTKPYRMAELERVHDDEIEIECSDLVYAALGTAVHALVTDHPHPDVQAEKRIIIPLEGLPISITGKPDIIFQKTRIHDIKCSGAYAMQFAKPDWVAQLNIYAWLVRREYDVEVTELVNMLILRDHKKSLTKASATYPPIPIGIINQPIWPDAKTDAFIRERAAGHLACRDAIELPLCTPEERWARETVYAVVSPGRKRSHKNCSSLAEAKQYIARATHKAKSQMTVDIRPGEDTRCIDYCPVNRWCPYYLERYGDIE